MDPSYVIDLLTNMCWIGLGLMVYVWFSLHCLTLLTIRKPMDLPIFLDLRLETMSENKPF
jgi:hypothetical protein